MRRDDQDDQERRVMLLLLVAVLLLAAWLAWSQDTYVEPVRDIKAGSTTAPVTATFDSDGRG